MAQIIWTEPALIQLNEIPEYIALSNAVAASDLVDKIFTKVERLQQFPKSGKMPLELPLFSYREIVIPPCRIMYRIENDLVYIVFVMREERDLRKFLLNNPIP
jgi:toxin ParE1/3/4